MSSILRFLSRLDWPLLLSFFFLAGFGLIGLYSASLANASIATESTSLLFGPMGIFWRQLMYLGCGIMIILITALINYSVLGRTAKLLYIFSAIFLIAVLFFGKTIRGTTGWFSIGGFGIQPVELVKVFLVIVLATFFAGRGRQITSLMKTIISFFITLPLVIFVLLQPDFGSAVLLFLIWFGMLAISGVRKLHLFALILGACAVAVLAWMFVLKPYQKDRIMVFWDPSRDPLGRGYNVTQSVIAVGSGGITGKGIGYGSQSQLRFLPERETDFIFAVLAEELGFIGIMMMSILFVILLSRFYHIALTKNDAFTVTMLTGFAIAIGLEVFINIGSNIRLLPVTGVTLPFVSYGGSSLLAKCLMIGIAESVENSR
jgi:rod shape determining protein RodA